jgi:Synergist-CTERM protein sorting domain-containing protein
VGVESRDLVVEYTASWPENVRYYSLFSKADGSGYENPGRGVQFEIKAGQSLPDDATPPDFYEEGEGLMTWRNVVTDGGSFDLEPAPGIVTFRVCSVRAAEATGNTGGGGCDASGGFAPLALLLLALPLVALLRKARE